MILCLRVCSDVCCVCLCCVFFFKQKTAYEMRISDWSSDVCSSDLLFRRGPVLHRIVQAEGPERLLPEWWHVAVPDADLPPARDYFRVEDAEAIGRASRRERVCQYV